ncbi:hypothetical protein B5M42_023060 [Paenibacillus athensensis]|uniref:PDZ domain-containing protein n=1 Tax=Paenibacillus athensensis TaxID=1967502 RepID=A0A4Y8PPR3_9BACL|nr:hypothetical protein [Paenibacillus athensensis]MCD1261686.1 hypothetical protein [Paenibacillus athensensis]
MKSKRLLWILLPILLTCQLWFTYISFHYPFMGIYVAKKADHWEVKNFEANVPYLQMGLQIGDVILKIDDHDPERFFTVKNFAQIEQANKLLISRNHHTYEITTDGATIKFSIFAYSLLGELLCLCIAIMLYLDHSGSRSARFLSFIFFIGGLAFMSLEASPRGDVLAKILITSIVMSLPFLFLHFLIVFFNEKGEQNFPYKFLYTCYGLIGLVSLPSIAYFTSLPAYTYFYYYEVITRVSFLSGSLMVVGFLIYIYMKFRKTQSYFSGIVRTVWTSFMISFMPLALFSFLPEAIWNKAMITPYITGMCTLFFPLSFFYLLSAQKIYHVQLILRRVLAALVIAVIPSAMMMIFIIPLFQNAFSWQRVIFIFLFTVTLISILLYSLEAIMSGFEAFLFPRKHRLQLTLKKIADDLSHLQSFRELQELILVDIVRTLQVASGAIVFQYEHDIDIMSEGDMEPEQIKQALTDPTPSTKQMYAVYEINRHEEYTSFLILGPKKTNTLFHKEELQWLKVVVSNLATSLENLYLIRKLT